MDDNIVFLLKFTGGMILLLSPLLIILSVVNVFFEVPIDIAEKICDKKGGEIQNDYPWSGVYCVVKSDSERVSYYFVEDNGEWFLKRSK